ncbi:glutaredoxin family protein [Lysobacter capsici]|uniref:glutaredoxin family protein n=1 Tax=Lysobacter capsici TaxID=435897 RepID=UPI001BFFDF63|nr:glutaredoxin family protein [Lysobacter capsici]QWF18279.1 glutaredoxin family protein [Lysobacter capsici]
MSPKPTVLTLFQRDDCHLCDLALAVLARARAPEFDSVFIDDDEALEARYGERVPVLRDEGRGMELDWPFDAAQVALWLERVDADSAT